MTFPLAPDLTSSSSEISRDIGIILFVSFPSVISASVAYSVSCSTSGRGVSQGLSSSHRVAKKYASFNCQWSMVLYGRFCPGSELPMAGGFSMGVSVRPSPLLLAPIWAWLPLLCIRRSSNKAACDDMYLCWMIDLIALTRSVIQSKDKMAYMWW